jgi:hypothetical protein
MFDRIETVHRKSVLNPVLILLLAMAGSLHAGSLSGKVTSSTGQALANVYIDLYDDDGDYFDYTATDASGVYRFSNLGTGGFYVHTDTLGGYVEEWYNNIPGASEDTFFEPLAAGATRVVVGYGDTVTGINLALDRAGSIAGKVTNASGAGLAGIYVDVYLPDGQRFQFDLTDASGLYVVAGLPAGTYAVRTDSLGVFVDRWHDQTVAFDSVSPSASGVVPLAVTAGNQTTNANIQLAVGSEIRGTLRDATGAPVRGVYVDLLASSGTRLEFDRSDTNGVYQLKGLPPGSYYLGTDGLGAYVDLWYRQRLMVNPKYPALDVADLVAVPPQTIVTNVNFAFDVGAAIAGGVVSTSGLAVTHAFVDVFLGTNFFDYALTDSNGCFQIGGLPDGTYYVKVDTLGAYLDEWYDDAVIVDTKDPVGNGASPVFVTNGLSVTGLVFTLRPGAEIIGQLTDADARGIPDVYLDLYDVGGQRRFFTRSATNGSFRLGGLPGGTYFLNTDSDGRYADEWYDARPVIAYTNPVADDATAIEVDVGESRTGVNLQLRPGGSIGGTVFATNAIRLVGARVNLYYGSRLFARSTTDSNGVYRIAALPEGVCYARVDSASGLLGEWYNGIQVLDIGEPIGDGATAIVISNDVALTGVDFALGSGGGIQGTVATETGAGISLAMVDLFDACGRYFDSAVCLANGSYAFPSLPPGTWYVGTDTLGSYVDEWFDDLVRRSLVEPFADGATPVTLAEGGTESVSFWLAVSLPNPVVMSLLLEAGGGVIMEWQAEADRAYQVERGGDLGNDDWSLAPSGATEIESSYKPAGTASLRQYQDPETPASAFYRVLSIP